MKLVGGTLRKGELGDALVAELFQLYANYYAPTSLEVFARDLASKSYSIVVRDPQGQIRGFSTVGHSSMLSSAGEIEVLFSGDTVVDRSFWGEQTLPFTWIEEAGRIKSLRPEVPLYWLLITKGHRTFRYLPGFAYAYAPGPGSDLLGLRDEIAHHFFGDRFDGRTGILKPDLGCPTALVNLSTSPHIVGFSARVRGTPDTFETAFDLAFRRLPRIEIPPAKAPSPIAPIKTG
jgi:hypothetical protein